MLLKKINCVAADGYDIDFLTQGIEQYNDGQFIWSKERKTTLGADDGIGMAIVLAVLDSKNAAHGPLECLFTWNEEDGLDGSAALSPDVLKSQYMINIDWEWESETCIGTAGGIMLAINLPYQTEAVGDDCAVVFCLDGRSQFDVDAAVARSMEVAVWHRDEAGKSWRRHGDLKLRRKLPDDADIHLRSKRK